MAKEYEISQRTLDKLTDSERVQLQAILYSANDLMYLVELYEDSATLFIEKLPLVLKYNSSRYSHHSINS